jgi:hypothetical protein
MQYGNLYQLIMYGGQWTRSPSPGFAPLQFGTGQTRKRTRQLRGVSNQLSPVIGIC